MKQNPKTYSHTVEVRTRPVTILCVVILGVLVGACSNKRVIQTVDDSTEYKSARALPPLKKPSRVLTSSSAPAPTSPAVEVDSSEPVETSNQAAVPESQVPANPEVASEEIPQLVAEESTVEQRSEPAVEPTPLEIFEETTDTAAPVVSARVVRAGSDSSVLEIDAEFEQAWSYLTRSLQKSDVTVFARNKEAGRFSIGCAGLANDASVVTKKGGWSFFSRAKNVDSEYCALQALEKRGKTSVSVVDRSGIVVLAENSEKLFERILNN